MTDRTMPKFSSEAEEAEWWFSHREEIAQDVVDASTKGNLGGGSLARRREKVGGPNAGSESGVVREAGTCRA